jgi:hypothetical protein
MRESRFQVSCVGGVVFGGEGGLRRRLVGLLSGYSGGSIERMAVDGDARDEYDPLRRVGIRQIAGESGHPLD